MIAAFVALPLLLIAAAIGIGVDNLASASFMPVVVAGALILLMLIRAFL